MPLALLFGAGGILAAGGLFSAAYLVAGSNGEAGHLLLWVGVLLAVAAFVGAVFSPGMNPQSCVVLCCLLGAVLFLPKLGRTPNDFIFFDELQHVRATAEILKGTRLFVYNPLNPVITHYPGLHILTAALVRATGISLFAAGNAVIATARVLLMASLFVIFRRLLGSARTASLAVLLYAANPAYLYFDAQFSYESLALPLAVTALAIGMVLGSRRGARRLPLAMLAASLIGAVIVTHHITAIATALLLLLFGGLIWLFEPQARRTARWLLGLGVLTAAAAAAWIVFVAPDTWHYLVPEIGDTLKTVPDFFSGHGSARAPFAKAPLPEPAYERVAALLSVIVAFSAFVAGAWMGRVERQRRGQMIASVLLGSLYFASLPLQLLEASSSTPIAPRLWEISFIGLAPLAAIAATRIIKAHNRIGLAAVVAGAFVMVMGGATIRSGENIRFPGRYIPSGGPRAVTPDTIAAARWLLGTYGPGHVVMSDVTLSSVFGAYALATPASYQNFGYRPWKVFFSATLDAAGQYELNRSGTEFVVVDRRITRYSPFGGYYFSRSEPRTGFKVVPARDLGKFNSSPFFQRVYDSGNIIIYRYSTTPIRAPVEPAHRKGAPSYPIKILLHAQQALEAGRLEVSPAK